MDLFDDFTKIERIGLGFHLARLDLRIVQYLVKETEQVFARPAHGAGIFPLPGCELRIQQQGRHADHSIHRGADFVAHVG